MALPAVLTAYDFVFSENGLMAHKEGKLIAQQSIKKHLGEEKLQVRQHAVWRCWSCRKLCDDAGLWLGSHAVHWFGAFAIGWLHNIGRFWV